MANYTYSGQNAGLQNLISAGLVNPQGKAWSSDLGNSMYSTNAQQRYGSQYYGNPLSQQQVDDYSTKLNDYYGKRDTWTKRLEELGQQYGQPQTQEFMDFLKQQPEYLSAVEASKGFDTFGTDINNSIMGDRRTGTGIEQGKNQSIVNGLLGNGITEPKLSNPSFLSKVGGGLANTIGKNPWVVALPMLSAAAPALLGTAGTAAGSAGSAAGSTLGSTGSWLSSLGKGIAGIPSYVSESLGGGTLGSIGAGAVKGAAIGGLSSGLSGGNIGEGILKGGLSGGVFGGAGSLLEGTQLGDFLGIEPQMSSADSAFLDKASAGSGLPWSTSPSTLSSLGKALGLGGGGSSSMGTLSTLLGGANNYFANKKALKQLNNAGNDAMSLLNPYIQQGSASTSRLADLLGLSGNSGAEGYGSLAQQFNPSDLQNDPGYQFQLAEGQKALDRNASARGGYYSGAALKDAAKYSQNLADTTYNDAFNRDAQEKSRLYSLLSGQQGVGYGAATGGADLLTSLGSARANSTVGLANNLNSTLANILYGNGLRYSWA